MGTSYDICAKLTEGSVASWIGEEMCLLGADGSLASVNESGSAVLKSLFEGMTLREAAVKYAEGRGIQWSTVALDATRMLSSLAEAGFLEIHEGGAVE